MNWWLKLTGKKNADGAVEAQVVDANGSPVALPAPPAQPPPAPAMAAPEAPAAVDAAIAAQLDAQGKTLAELQRRLEAAERANSEHVYAARAREFAHLPGTLESHAASLRAIDALSRSDPKAAEALLASMRTASSALGESSLFRELGAGFGHSAEASDIDQRVHAVATDRQRAAEARGEKPRPLALARLEALEADPQLARGVIAQENSWVFGKK